MSMFRIKQQMDEQVQSLDRNLKAEEESKIKEAIEQGMKSKNVGEIGKILNKQAEANVSKAKMMADM